MGYTELHKEKYVKLLDFFKQEFNCKNEVREWEVLACSTKSNVAYLACKLTTKEEVKVVAVVCILSYPKKDPYYNFGYKDMDETMGPYYYDCPEKILKLLTPTNSIHAKEWRELCYKNLSQKKSNLKLKEGDLIKFDSPLKFSNGYAYEILKVASLKPLRFCDKGDISKQPILFRVPKKVVNQSHRIENVQVVL